MSTVLSWTGTLVSASGLDYLGSFTLTQVPVSTTPPIISTTPPVISTTPPVISTTLPIISTTPPVISTAPPSTAPSSTTVPSGKLPGQAGQTYVTDTILASYSRNNFGILQPTWNKPPLDAVYVSNLGIAGDYTSFSKAQAAAENTTSKTIIFRDGDTLTNGQDQTWGNNVPGNGNIDDNIKCSGLTISRVGPSGVWNDFSKAPPTILGCFPIGANNTPINNLRVFGPLNFYADKRDPASSTYNNSLATNGYYQQFAFMFREGNVGTQPCSNWLFSAINCNFMGFDIEGIQPTGSVAPIYVSSVVLDHVILKNAWGQKFGLYAACVYDLCLNEFIFAHNGWNATASPKSDPTGREHNIYSQAMCQPAPTTLQHRYINGILAIADSDGIKAASGGLFENVLLLANPVGMIAGEFPTNLNGVVFDFANAEFDVVFGKGNTLALTAGGSNGGARGWGFYDGGCASLDLNGVYFINKVSDGINDSGFPIGFGGSYPYEINNNSNGNPTYNSGPITLENVVIKNVYCVGDTSQDANGVHIGDTPPTPVYKINAGVDLKGTGSYVNGNVTTTSYAKTLGFNNAVDFLAAAENNSFTNWNEALTGGAVVAYIKNGFTAA